MLSIACSQQGRWLDSLSIKKISCEELTMIDQLWVNYSNGKFGYSIQKSILEKVEKNIDKFGNCVGWRNGDSWIEYARLKFDIKIAPEGHLPFYLDLLGFVWKSGWFNTYWDGDIDRIWKFVSKLDECNIKS